MFDCCFQKLFFVLENRKHSKTCLTIVPRVFKFVLHVLNLVFLENNLKLFSPFSTLWTKQKKKTSCREQITNPLKMHHTTNWTKSQIHTQRTNTQTLKFVFSKFIFFSQFPSPNEKSVPVLMMMTTLQFELRMGQWRWVNMCMWERER